MSHNWRVFMRCERVVDYGDSRIHCMVREYAPAIAEMRYVLPEGGTVSNRDLEMATRIRTQSYRWQT